MNQSYLNRLNTFMQLDPSHLWTHYKTLHPLMEDFSVQNKVGLDDFLRIIPPIRVAQLLLVPIVLANAQPQQHQSSSA